MNNNFELLLKEYDRLFKEQQSLNENVSKTLEIQDEQIEFLRAKLLEVDKAVSDLLHLHNMRRR